MSNSLQSSYENPTPQSGYFTFSAPDLTKAPPRSPRARLGGFAQLPRLIDKARAFVAGTNGDFHYNCPVDQRFFTFSGVDPEKFLEQVKAGKGDGELLAYVMANLSPKRQPFEIVAWSTWFEQLTPAAPDKRAFFNDLHRKNGEHRHDIATWCDWLELDDFVSYGGKA